MQSIKSKNTKIEIALGKALWHKGYRYRKNNKTIIGTPDFTFKKLKIAIFCDGEFWHGKDWEKKKRKLGTNIEFWQNKIERNIQRDIDVNNKLKQDGWIVLRFWGEQIKSDLPQCIRVIEQAIENAKKQT